MEVHEMTILAWIIVGSIAGWLAKGMAPGESSGGILGDLVVGAIGALMGGWIFTSYGHPGVGGSIVMAYIGAVAFLWVQRALTTTLARTSA